WSFPVDGAPSQPGGDLTAGYHWRRLGAALRAGVSGESTFTAASTAGPITLAARRFPLAAELSVDLWVRGGAGRLAAGPLAALWWARTSGLPRPASTVFAEPGLFLRAAYRLELGRVVLHAGVAFEAVFFRDDLTVGGVGVLGHTPVFSIAPYLGAGFGL